MVQFKFVFLTKVLFLYTLHCYTGTNVDFNSDATTAKIVSRTNKSMVNITVIDDNIVERNETFIMSLKVPPSLGPGIIAGLITNATATIIDTTGK